MKVPLSGSPLSAALKPQRLLGQIGGVHYGDIHERSVVVATMSRSRLLLVALLVLVTLALVAGSYQLGRRMRYSNQDNGGVYYTQAMLAFGHYTIYGKIAAELEKKCYDAALIDAREMKNLQTILLADNLRATGNDPSLLEYIKLRDAELLKSVLAGHVPEARPYTTTCP